MEAGDWRSGGQGDGGSATRMTRIEEDEEDWEKEEIRNPKSEIRNKFKIPILNL